MLDWLPPMMIGAWIGWMLHSIYDVTWAAWVEPRVKRWFIGELDEE